ncbi:hypothetical protein [Streptomyces sp. NPDC053427]|uniref:hypothetical protein n=1 Tax=Streptomyces sp. NPDC053427 TaxID=3365701 RepID=UPI0037CCF24B
MNFFHNPGSHPDRNPDNVSERVYLRLIADDMLPPEIFDAYDYVQPVAEGLAEALSLDLGDAVRMFRDSDVAEYGLDALRAAGRANLLEDPYDYDLAELEDGTVIHLVAGDSHYVASQVLVLEEVLRATWGHPPPPAGVLLAIPGRHHFAFHPIVDHHAGTAAKALASFGLESYENDAENGPISPYLYWWCDGAMTALTTFDNGDGTLTIELPEELMPIVGPPA